MLVNIGVREVECAITAGDQMVHLYPTEREFNPWTLFLSIPCSHTNLVPFSVIGLLQAVTLIVLLSHVFLIWSAFFRAIGLSAMSAKFETYHLVGDFDEKGSHTLRSVVVAGYFYPCFDGLRTWVYLWGAR